MAKFCACGCGGEVAENRTYVKGHHLRKHGGQQEESNFPPPLTSVATPPALKVHIWPHFRGEDNGEGGIRRVVEAQYKHLPQFGIEIVDTAEEAEVIFAHASIPETYIKLYPDKAFVAMCHGFYWSEYEWGGWQNKANSDVMENIRVSDVVVACSEWVANAIRRHTSRNVRVVHLGIDVNEWEPAEPMEYVLWNKTRIDPICNPAPVNQLARLLPGVQFASTFGEEAQNVKLTGKLPYQEAKELIRHAGVYLATTRETFGIGTLEALACGVPVVGYRWGGHREFLTHSVDSYLATPGDVQDLAKGVEWAIANRAEVSSACIRTAAKFDWSVSAKKFAEAIFEAYELKHREGPRTSIIVTNYDLHEYLDDCLNSVMNQSDNDWECIVVDDASTNDSGKAIVQKFVESDNRFKLIANEKNQYLAEARNIGIRASRGKYILPLDADDMLPRDSVQILADSLDNHRENHVAYGKVFFVNEDGATPTDYGIRGIPAGLSIWPFKFNHEQQAKQFNVLPYSSMFRKQAWLQTGGYRRRCRTAEDADMWLRFSSYGFRPAMVTEQPTLIYRNRKGSMSRSNSTDWAKWFVWSKMPETTPAGAVTSSQMPVSSLEPIQVSVVIPVGPGHQKVLSDAIDSVDAQTIRNWECIVVNDTGGPLGVELPSWVRLLETEGSRGPAGARNVGIAAARGSLYLPLDADDYLEPYALQFMLEAYSTDGGVIYSDFWETFEDGTTKVFHCDDYDARNLTGRTRMVNGQKREGMIHSVTALTPVKYWQDVGGYDENMPGWEDWDFALAIADKGYCSRKVALPLFTYRKFTGFRRDANYDKFQESKQGILAKWGHLWEGGKELMACQRCGARASYYPNGATASKLAAKPPVQEGAVLVKYTGPRVGSTPYKGHSGTTYWFGQNDSEKYVLAQDVEIFKRFSGFEIVEAKELAGPALVAEGKNLW